MKYYTLTLLLLTVVCLYTHETKANDILELDDSTFD